MRVNFSTAHRFVPYSCRLTREQRLCPTLWRTAGTGCQVLLESSEKVLKTLVQLCLVDLIDSLEEAHHVPRRHDRDL